MTNAQGSSRAKVQPIPDQYRGVTPYLAVSDAGRAIEFYKRAFGATEVLRIGAPGGKVGHAELRIGSGLVMLADEYPEIGHKSPATLGGTPVGLAFYCEDVDATVQRAVAAGATLQQPVTDKFYGDRAGQIEDPFGHRWYVATHIEDVPPDEMQRRAQALHGG